MHLRLALSAIALTGIASTGVGAELRVYPPEVTLSGLARGQQLIVVEEENGRVIRDHTPLATYSSSHPTVVQADAQGRLSATGNGVATVTAVVKGQSATARVRVAGFGKAADWNLRNHVIPVLTRAGCNSGACHGALAGKGGMKLSLRGYDPESDWFVLTRQALARRVDLARPDESLVLKKAARRLPHGGGTRLVQGDDGYARILEWIVSGAPGVKESDPRLERIELFPSAALLRPGEALRVIVRAVYSDGTTEDVSRLSRFASNDELVAGVSEEGLATIKGHGEAAIIVNFGTRVATVTITSPFANKIDAAAFASSRRNNFIDEHILGKLELLRLPPSGPCTDAEFLRRAFLDTCGIIPPVAEAEKFLADPDPNKRVKLIERLFTRPEFVDYWSYKWSDLLLVSSRKLPQPAMWSFYRRVRQSVADNEPWDRFARGIINSSGSTLVDGGGNYFVLHKDISDLAEATAITFLGTSIGCAKCHNHPLEKWTQDEYWAFANLFSRVALKNGERAGEVVVQSRLEGEALHLRTGMAMVPTPLDGKPLPSDLTVDRRAYLGNWLTAPENPYFARAIVNRVWRSYMGRGLVEAEDDLRVSNPASNKELLDALAEDFVKNGHDLRRLMKLILSSATYQRSSRPLAANAVDDRYYSRYLVRRLPAEVILDAYSDITGVPTNFTQLRSAAGDSASPVSSYPVGTRAMQLPDSLLLSHFLEVFGRAERVAACSCERSTDASVGQALHLNNGATLNEKLRDKRSVVSKWLAANATDAEIVDLVFLHALSRKPTVGERKKFLEILVEAAKDGAKARREAIEDFVWAVLTGREFLFNH